MKRFALILFLVFGVTFIAIPLFAQGAADTAAAPVAGAEDETDIVAGKVATVDVANNTLTVTDEAGKSYAVMATKEETSIWKGDDTISLSDVKTGDSVELEYYKNKESKLVAIWVDVLTKEVAAPAEAKPAEMAPAAPAAPAEATQAVPAAPAEAAPAAPAKAQ